MIKKNQMKKKITATCKIEEELIKNISLRVGELLKKQDTGNFNDATPYAFQVGLTGDVEEAFKKAATQKTESKKGYYCSLCKEFICKYQMDLKCCEIKTKEENKLICDDCAKKIANYVVEEF
jgi:hypothetical protein